MKFGLNQESRERVEPQPGLLAICPLCESELVAKCGDINVHHWAHKRQHSCDHWWEIETEWHRKWKNRFPKDWQEVIKLDEFTGEKHIADIFNAQLDLVIEFQNSPIDIREIQSREGFFKRMIWVVNAEKFQLSTFTLDKWNADIFRRIKPQIKESILGSNEQGGNRLTTSLEMFHKQLEYYQDKNQTEAFEESYIQYKWSNRKKVWDIANAPVFLDLGDEIVLIKSDFIAKRIPLERLMKKYAE